MAAKRGSRRRQRKQLEGANMSDIFLEIGPQQSESIIFRALSHRSEASEGVRSSLNAAIDNHVKMEGFLRPSRANPNLIKDSALFHLIAKANDKLAGALLRAWVESHPELRDAVKGKLADADVALETPDFKVGRFVSKWDNDEWRKMAKAVAPDSDDNQVDHDLDEAEAELMVMCVSGKSHQIIDEPTPVESNLFGGWLEQLDALAPDAPEWKETQSFLDSVTKLADQKSKDLRLSSVKSIDETVAAVKTEFDEELRYLEIDLRAWTGENAAKRHAAADAKNLAEDLRERLAEYRPLRPQAPSRAEESERGPKRDEAEKAVLDLVSSWANLKGAPPISEEIDALQKLAKSRAEAADNLPESGPGSKAFAEMTRMRKEQTDELKKTDELSSDEYKEKIQNNEQELKEKSARIERLESDNSQLKASNSDLKSLNDAVSEENARLKRANAELAATADSSRDVSALEEEAGRLRADNDRLTADKQRLELDNAGLRSDMELLGAENDGLRAELARSGENEEYWRNAYIDANASQTRVDMGLSEHEDPNSVNEALEIAQNMFPGQLAIALNSKSSKNSPFRKPDEVLGALSWLATEYHNRRSNPSASRPDFNKLLKESCPGWFYKPGQTEVTAEQFSAWYTTEVDGKIYRLDHHIGKGNSHDPQHTIRIAFEWDDELDRVAVGFLGLHQRNRRS